MNNENKNNGGRVAVTVNDGRKGLKAGEEGAYKIDAFVAGNRTWDVSIGDQPKSVRRRYLEMYEALYLKYEVEYDEYAGRAQDAKLKPKSEQKLGRKPIAEQPEHVREKYIGLAESYYVKGLIDYRTYSERVTAAGGTPQAESAFDRQ